MLGRFDPVINDRGVQAPYHVTKNVLHLRKRGFQLRESERLLMPASDLVFDPQAKIPSTGLKQLLGTPQTRALDILNGVGSIPYEYLLCTLRQRSHQASSLGFGSLDSPPVPPAPFWGGLGAPPPGFPGLGIPGLGLAPGGN